MFSCLLNWRMRYQRLPYLWKPGKAAKRFFKSDAMMPKANCNCSHHLRPCLAHKKQCGRKYTIWPSEQHLHSAFRNCLECWEPIWSQLGSSRKVMSSWQRIAAWNWKPVWCCSLLLVLLLCVALGWFEVARRRHLVKFGKGTNECEFASGFPCI